MQDKKVTAKLQNLVKEQNWDLLAETLTTTKLSKTCAGKKEDTLFHLALEEGCPARILRQLLSKGQTDLKVNFAELANAMDSTPLHTACTNNLPLEIIKLLVDAYPAALSMKDDGPDMTPLDWAKIDTAKNGQIIDLLETLSVEEIRACGPKTEEILVALEAKKTAVQSDAVDALTKIRDDDARSAFVEIQMGMWNCLKRGDPPAASHSFSKLQELAHQQTARLGSLIDLCMTNYKTKGGTGYYQIHRIEDFKAVHARQMEPPAAFTSDEDRVTFLLTMAAHLESGFRDKCDKLACTFNNAESFQEIIAAYDIRGFGLTDGVMVRVLRDDPREENESSCDMSTYEKWVSWSQAGAVTCMSAGMVTEGSFIIESENSEGCTDTEFNVRNSELVVLADESGWKLSNADLFGILRDGGIVNHRYGPPKSFDRALAKIRGSDKDGNPVPAKTLKDLNRVTFEFCDPRIMELAFCAIKNTFRITGVKNKHNVEKFTQPPSIHINVDIGGGYKGEKIPREDVQLVAGVGMTCEYFKKQSQPVESGCTDAWWPATITGVQSSGNVDVEWDGSDGMAVSEAVGLRDADVDMKNIKGLRAEEGRQFMVGDRVTAECSITPGVVSGAFVTRVHEGGGAVDLQFDGWVAEIQLLFKDILEIKKELHNFYDVTRAEGPLVVAKPVF
jgi:hypothetical protein